MSPLKTYFKRTQHLEGVAILDAKLFTNVRQRNSFLYIGAEHFVRHNHVVEDFCVSYNPSIGYPSEFLSCLKLKLLVCLHPVIHFCVDICY